LTRATHRRFSLTAAVAAALGFAALLGFAGAARAQTGAGPQWYGQGFGKNKIQYRDFDWEIYHSPHFNVHYYKAEEAQLQKVVSFAESAYDQLSREFNFQIQEPIPLIFYATHSAFEQNNVILNFIPEGTGAFASPVRFRMVLPIDLPDPELMELILHELTHIFEYQMLFQGSLAKGVATSPPLWFMEGLASYMAKDETAREKMYLRDAVVNDQIPSVRADFGGFFAYRFGHAVFDFIEERWGREGLLDFLYEVRNTIGSRVDRAVERAFKLEPEEFDIEFRRWLRKKYLPQLLETGEPGDFGRVFRVERDPNTQEISPSASPSGDLVASFSVIGGDVDIVLFDAEKRTYLRNLTKGFTNEYQYLVTQELRLGRAMGRDLSFSPDGNRIAAFAKRERGRSLLLIDVLRGKIDEVIDTPEVEQQLAPSWSPDGKKIVFYGWKNGQFDIFTLDLETRTVAQVTNDAIYDGGPVFSPDGKSIVFVSVIGNGYGKLFRVDLDKPGQRFQLTSGESNDNDPIYAPDGKRIYFTSDRDGQQNIYSLDLASGEIRQYTNVVTGAFMPTVLSEPQGEQRLVFTGYWKGDFDLYVTDVDEPIGEPQVSAVPVEPVQNVPAFEPDIQVTIDDANRENYRGFKFFLEGASSYIAVDDNQDYYGQIFLNFSDYLGDRRILAQLSSVESFSNFDVYYVDLSDRLQWQVHLFDDRDYYLVDNVVEQRTERLRSAITQTGVIGSLVYPFTFYTRGEIGAGYIYRKFNFLVPVLNEETGEVEPSYIPFTDDFPLVTGALVGDSTIFAPWGPISGRRWRLDTFYAPDLDEGGTLMESADLDIRQYIPVTRRSNLALRGFAGISEGNRPSPYYFGGIDTIRGTRFRDLSGDRAFFANVEYRFPLIDVLATPILNFRNIRGNLFFDVGGAWYDDFQDFKFFQDGENRLQDAVSSYGFGVSVQFLYGLDFNWDFATLWDFKDVLDHRTSFWIGTRF
jgi:Tol biopolymer transport system component